MLGNHGRSVATTIFTPFAKLLHRLHVTPNMVTATSTTLVVMISCAVLARGYVWQAGVILGVILLCDSVDGVLARYSGQTSRFGAFLDSTMDRLGDGAVFGALLVNAVFHLEPSPERTTAIIAGTVAMVGVAAVPYARAKAEIMGITASVGIAERTDRLIIALVCAALTDWNLWSWFYPIGLIWVAFASLITVTQRVLYTKKQIEAGDAGE